MALISLENVGMKYGSGNNFVHALKEINLQVEEGDFIAITGKSGCGKSTLLNILGNITKPTSGKYYFEDMDVTGLHGKRAARFRNQKIGFVVQHYALIKEMSVQKNVGLPLVYQGRKRKEIVHRVKELLTQLEIEEKAANYPYELSGGQCQRAAIARAMIAQPRVLLADEPTGALDEETGEMIMKVFRDLNEKGMTIILVTHDMDIAACCKRRIFMKDGCIEE